MGFIFLFGWIHTICFFLYLKLRGIRILYSKDKFSFEFDRLPIKVQEAFRNYVNNLKNRYEDEDKAINLDENNHLLKDITISDNSIPIFSGTRYIYIYNKIFYANSVGGSPIVLYKKCLYIPKYSYLFNNINGMKRDDYLFYDLSKKLKYAL